MIDNSIDRQERRQALGSSGLLALVVAGFHSNAAIRPCRINCADIVLAQEGTRMTASQEHDLHILSNFAYHLVEGLPRMIAIDIDESRFAQHVEVFGLDNEVAFAAGAALVALKSRHRMERAEQGYSWCDKPATAGLHKSSDLLLRFACGASRRQFNLSRKPIVGPGMNCQKSTPVRSSDRGACRVITFRFRLLLFVGRLVRRGLLLVRRLSLRFGLRLVASTVCHVAPPFCRLVVMNVPIIHFGLFRLGI